eukprot:scaffold125017_cov33-Tisochrysis_lutea.AAC.4
MAVYVPCGSIHRPTLVSASILPGSTGGRSDDGEFIPLTSEIRTSWTTWCDTKECLADKHVQALSERMSKESGTLPNSYDICLAKRPTTPIVRYNKNTAMDAASRSHGLMLAHPARSCQFRPFDSYNKHVQPEYRSRRT